MGDGLVLMAEEDESLYLPPGFRFHPTDEEIISNYLWEKALDSGFSARAMGEVDLNRCEPWDLPSKAKMGEKEWYFFCHRDRKYPTGMRTNRATDSGYWKATGKDKEIYKGRSNLVGMKKTLVFYMGRAPKGEKTNWVMHEYRLEGKSSTHSLPRALKDEWVVCRVFHKNTDPKRNFDESDSDMMRRTNSFSILNTSFGDEFLESPTLPPLLESPYLNTTAGASTSSIINNNNNNNNYGTGGDYYKGSTSSSVQYLSNLAMDHKTSLIPNYALRTQQVFFTQAHQLEASSSLTRKPCKEEDYSYQSLVSASQETILSNDRNMEISSALMPEITAGGSRICDDLDGLSSPMMPVIDMEDIYWKF